MRIERFSVLSYLAEFDQKMSFCNKMVCLRRGKLTSALQTATASRRSAATLRNIWTGGQRRVGVRQDTHTHTHRYKERAPRAGGGKVEATFSTRTYRFEFRERRETKSRSACSGRRGAGLDARREQESEISGEKNQRNLSSAEEFLPVRQSLLLLSPCSGQ